MERYEKIMNKENIRDIIKIKNKSNDNLLLNNNISSNMFSTSIS